MAWPALKVVRPATIGDAQLSTSNVPETPPAAFDVAHTYALNDQASIFSGTSTNVTIADVYQSLANANTGHTPPNATWWKLIGRTYKAWSGATLYFIGDRVVDTTNHLVYQSVVGSNGAPLSDDTSWVLVGPSNKWAMFDQSSSTQSEVERQIAVTLLPAGRVDTVALFNLQAATVRIQSSTSGYDETYDLTETSGIADWYAWFFEPIVRRDKLVVADLPAYLSQTLTITIDNGTGTVLVGNLVVGQSLDLGMTLEGADSGIVSYSKIDVNQWGDYTLTQRKRVKKLTLQVDIDNDDVDKADRLLASFDAVPTVWRGTEDYDSLSVYGIFRNFGIAFSYPTHSVCSLDLEGLT